MTNFKHQGLVKALFCLNILLNAGTINADPLDFEGPNLIGPRKPCRPKQDWENKKPQGQRESYIATHNAMAAKYGFTQYVIDPQASYEGPTLVKSSEIFKDTAKKVKEVQEANLKKTNAFGKNLLNGGSTIAEIVIDETVKNKSAKNVLIQLKDDLTDYLKKSFY